MNDVMNTCWIRRVITLSTAVNLLVFSCLGLASPKDNLVFDDTMLKDELVYPDWFNSNFGDLRDDLAAAKSSGKIGIVVYFGQKRCAYCEKFIQSTLGTSDIKNYMSDNFDVIPIDIWGIENIIDSDGVTYTEAELAEKYRVNFTPSLIFYDNDGNKVFRLRGFYPPYQYRAALKYVVEKFYKKETFRDYLARAKPGTFFYEEGMTERDFFTDPPFELDKTVNNTKKPLAVFFEKGKCHACDLLHTGPLNDKRTLAEMSNITSIQLNMASDTPVTTPAGKKTTAEQWARELGLFYVPAIVFFDEQGKEVLRVDSVVQFYRLWGVLDYISNRGYKTTKTYQQWRLGQRKISE